MTYRPPQCSEAEVGGHEDCTWCSGVMLDNAAHAAAVRPSTRAEYEALRVAGGDGPAENPGDGSNLAQLVLGMQRRYGWTPERVGPPGEPHPPFADILAELSPGRGAALQGSMGVFSRTGHWRRHDPQFGGAHCVYVQREDSASRVWWMNPSAPSNYHGEWMGLDDLRRYYDGFTGGAAYATIGQLEDPMIPIKTNGPYDVKLEAGDQLYDQAFRPLVDVSDPQTAVGHFLTGTGYVALTIVIRTQRQMVFAKVADVTVAPRRYLVTVGGKAAGTAVLP